MNKAQDKELCRWCAGGWEGPGPAKPDEVSPTELGCALYELGEAGEDEAPVFQYNPVDGGSRHSQAEYSHDRTSGKHRPSQQTNFTCIFLPKSGNLREFGMDAMQHTILREKRAPARD